MNTGIGASNTKTPPSDHAMSCLLRLYRYGPHPSQEVNFTVRDKLAAWGYVTLEDRPSPYKTHKPGKTVLFMVATPEGEAALRTKGLIK